MTPPASLPRPHPGPVIDGQSAAKAAGRWRRRLDRLLVSDGEREEAGLERRLAEHPAIGRANTVAVISPKGGVGKTTCSFAVGGLLADRLRLRVVAVDADPESGTLAALAPARVRCQRTLADLLSDLEAIHTATQLRGYMTPMPSGLHLLGAPLDPDAMAGAGPEAYGGLLVLLSAFYDLIMLDLGSGIADKLAQFAICRADQVVLVTTPDCVTSSIVLAALEHLEHEPMAAAANEHMTVAVNKVYARGAGDVEELERRLSEGGLHNHIVIPYDDQLAGMLETHTFQLDGLARISRMALKRLGLSVADQLV